jgi:sugar phosphate permease
VASRAEDAVSVDVTGPRHFHGWRVVAAGSALQALIGGLMLHAFGSYAVLMQREFGWSKSTFALAWSFNRAESGLLGPLHGVAVDRYGTRIVMRIGVATFAVGFVVLSLVRSPTEFILAFVVLAVGASLCGFLSVLTDVVKWFRRRRATAISRTMMGMAIGGLLSPLVVWGMEELGWRTMARVSAVIVIAVGYPLTIPFGSSPEERGVPIDGKAEMPITHERADTELVTVANFSAREALRTRAFWMISFGHATALLVVGAVMAHLALYLTEEAGFSLRSVSLVVSALTVCQIFGMLAGGVIGDRMSKRLLCALAMLGHMAGMLCLCFATNSLAVVLFLLLHGVSWGIRGPLMNALRADYFGAASFGSVMGLSSMIVMFGTVGGPLFAGFLADATGSYRLGLAVLAVGAGLGSVLFALASPPTLAARQ